MPPKRAEAKSISSDDVIIPQNRYAGLVIAVMVSCFAAFLASGTNHKSVSDVGVEEDDANLTQCNGRALFETVRSHPNGYVYPSIVVESDPRTPGGYRLMTNSQIMAGVNIFSVPDSMAMRPTKHQLTALDKTNKTKIGWEANDSFLSMRLNSTETEQLVGLTIRLLLEKRLGRKSKYFEYIRCLPKTCKNLICFQLDELLELQDRYVLDRVRADISRLQRVREEIDWVEFQVDPGPMPSEWLWAVGIILSKSFKVGGRLRLVPVIDLATHGPNAGPVIPPTKSNMQMWQKRSLGMEKGNTVQHAYRFEETMPEYDLLYHFGFVSGHSAHAYLNLEIDWHDPSGSEDIFASAHRRFAEIDPKKVKIGMEDATLRLTLQFTLLGHIPQSTYNYFKLLCHLLHNNMEMDEAYVHRMILKTVESHLKQKKETRIEEDMHLLQDESKLRPRIREAVRYRLIRKQVVRATSNALLTRLLDLHEDSDMLGDLNLKFKENVKL